MITTVFGNNFKGLTFEDALEEKNLYMGPMGSGKSARAHALLLAITGYINLNGNTYKKPGDVLDTFGDGKKFSVGFFINETSFERMFSRGAKGVTSQVFRVGGTKCTKTHYYAMMGESGIPKVFDPIEFAGLSDAKTIDTIFTLFPPRGDVIKISNEIDTLVEKRDKIAGDIRTSEGAAAKLYASKTAIVVPAGTLADVNNEIKETLNKIEELREDLKQEEMNVEKINVTRKTRANTLLEIKYIHEGDDLGTMSDEEYQELYKKANDSFQKKQAEDFKEKQGETQDKKNNVKRPQKTEGGYQAPAGLKKSTDTDMSLGSLKNQNRDNYPSAEENVIFSSGETTAIKQYNPVKGFMPLQDVIISLEKIIKAMGDTGCEMCVAAMIAKQELKKFTEVK